MDRAEHLQWCKDRAAAYLDSGDVVGASSSMLSDLRKHPDTEEHAGIQLTIMLLMAGHLGTVEAMRRHIDGFN